MQNKVQITTDFINLGQLIKYVGIVQNGGQVKSFLQENTPKVNGEIDQRRGKKLFEGDKIEINGKEYIIFKEK